MVPATDGACVVISPSIVAWSEDCPCIADNPCYSDDPCGGYEPNNSAAERGQRPPALDRSLRRLSRSADDHPGHDDRQRRPALDPEGPGLQPVEPHLGDRRLPDHLR